MSSLQTSRLPFLRSGILSICLACATPGASAADPKLNLTGSKATAVLPKVQADWPIPNDANMVFYIQRSSNRNTVVYTAQFDVDGTLQPVPIKAYWRRYAEQGQTRTLKFVERVFAYGIKSQPNTGGRTWSVAFAALSDLPLELRQSGPNSTSLWATINNRDYKLIYGYLDLDESGLFTRVVQLRLFSFDPASKKYVTHLISVSGGDIHE